MQKTLKANDFQAGAQTFANGWGWGKRPLIDLMRMSMVGYRVMVLFSGWLHLSSLTEGWRRRFALAPPPLLLAKASGSESRARRNTQSGPPLWLLFSLHTWLVVLLLLPLPSHNPCNAAADGATAIATKKYPIPKKKTTTWTAWIRSHGLNPTRPDFLRRHQKARRARCEHRCCFCFV